MSSAPITHPATFDPRRRRLMLALPSGLALASPLAFVACGGGGDSGDDGGQAASAARVKDIMGKLPSAQRSAAKVSVVLPAGAGVVASATRLMTTNNIAEVAADGTSAAVLIGQGAQMAYVLDAAGRLLLMGIVDVGSSEILDARSTAEALILLTSQAALFGDAHAIALRKTLRTHAIVEPVQRAVEAAAAKGGIGPDDAGLMSALNDALKALFPRSAAAMTAARKRAASVTVTPNTVESGIAMVPTDTYNTVQWRNEFRRRAHVWIARTGYVGADGTEVTEPNPVPVTDFALSATTPVSFDNLVVAVGDLLAEFAVSIGALDAYDSGAAPWQPVFSDPVVLPLTPADAKRTRYHTRIVGVGAIDGGQLSAVEATTLEQLQVATLVEDVCIPLVRQILLPIIGDRLGSSSYDSFVRISNNLFLNGAIDFASVFAGNSFFPKTKEAMQKGNGTLVIQQFLTEFASSNTWQVLYNEWMRAVIQSADPRGTSFGPSDVRDSTGKLIGVNLLDDASLVKNNVDKLVAGLNKVAQVIIVAKTLATAADWGAMANDWGASSTMVQQDLDVTGAKLTLSPNPAKADPTAGAAGKAAITAALEGLDASLPGADIFLHWTCTARYGNLFQVGGSGVDEFDSSLTSPTHDYIPSGVEDDPAQPDVITVVASYRNPQNAKTIEIAKATTTIQLKKKFTLGISPASSTLPTDASLPIAAFINEALPTGTTVAWTWSISGAGSLGASQQSSSGKNSTAVLTTGSSDGKVTVSVTARVSVPASAGVPATVITTNPVKALLDVKAGQRTITFRAGGGVFPCEVGCGVSDYTAYIVPRMAKATNYTAVFSGFGYGPCNRTVSWTTEKGDGGGCSFPISYHPFAAREAAQAWAVWIGFGGALPTDGHVDVTITLAP